MARRVAKNLDGVIENRQEDTVELPRGEKRYIAPKRAERFSTLTLSWWHTSPILQSRPGVTRFLSELERHVPEAIPVAFGTHEPAPNKTAEVGRDALIDFILEDPPLGFVFKTARPVVELGLVLKTRPQPTNTGYRANHVSLSFEATVLDQPGWETGIRSLWRSVSAVLQPFYGDVRILSGNVWVGSTMGGDGQAEDHPVRSWFWRGIPPKPGIALVLGGPYRDEWQPDQAIPEGRTPLP